MSEVNSTWTTCVILNLQQRNHVWVRENTRRLKDKSPVENSVWTLEILWIPNSLETIGICHANQMWYKNNPFLCLIKNIFLKYGQPYNH